MRIDHIRRSWVEIDTHQLVENVKIYSSVIPKKSSVMAVVKADAYGHGFQRVAQALVSAGVTHFAVSNIIEAIQLRDLGIKGEILILGYTPPENIPLLFEYDITQTLISYEYAQMILRECGEKRLKCHVAIDSGMNRIGLDADDTDTVSRQLRELAALFDVVGIFTHLCVADSKKADDVEFTKGQLSKFKAVINSVSDLGIPEVHCMNSAGGLFYDGDACNLVRLGIVMYGLKPDIDNQLPKGIKPILTWKSVVSMIKTVGAGESIGYGRCAILKQDRMIATIPTGYADGYRRDLSDKGYVLIDGQKANIVGNICMDQMMVDVTDIQDVSVGDEVILIGESGEESITADEMACSLGTIGYEIVCNISPRVSRIYKTK